jgi:hypothetical protein
MRPTPGLAAVLLAAFFVRGYSFFCFAYPTGADYGHHTMYADQYLEQGRLPETFPFYQLGGSRWSNLPGGALAYALIAAMAGTSAFEIAAVTALFGVIEVAGVFLLARRLFPDPHAALVAAAVAAVLPSGALMVAWSGYANLLALALIPYGLASWLHYWETPSVKSGVTTILVLCGILSIHHLSSMWIGLTLVVFALVHLVSTPGESARKLLPAVAGGCLLGLPLLLRAADLYGLFLSGFPDGAGRFDVTRISWENGSQTASAFSLVFLTGGLLHFFRGQGPAAPRVLVGSYAAVSIFFGFGWIFGLEFYYVRALYFLSIPAAIGAAALLVSIPRELPRRLATASVVTALGVSTSFLSEDVTRYYEGLSPGVIEAADWLREFSEPEDVIVAATSFGYHLPRLVARPTMVALTPELVGNPDDVEAAEDALCILMGLEGMNEAIERRGVKYIMVRAEKRDLPDPARSRAVLSSHPEMRIVFRNADVIIYGVLPL